MKRTFFALELDEPFAKATIALMDLLRGDRLMPRGRWVSPEILHVTLRFLGDTDEALDPALVALVASLGRRVQSPIDVRSTSLLAFPNPRRAHVLGLHLDDGGATVELASHAEDAVTALGFPAEQRPFRSHLTLARFREPADLRRLFAAHASPLHGGRLSALTFYASELGKGGPVHTALARHPFEETSISATSPARPSGARAS